MSQKKVQTKGSKKITHKTTKKTKVIKANKPKKALAKKLIVKKIVKKKVVKKKVVKKIVKKAMPKVVKKVVVKAKPQTKAKSKKRVTSKVSAVFGPLGVKPYQLKAKEEYMNEKQLEHLRQILLNWKAQLMDEVDRTVHHMQDEAANYPDPIDRASQEEEFNLELRTRDRERKLLKKIEETLIRINDHDYGYCDDCGAEIGMRRLEARPTATQCIECKTIAEIREKQVGEGV